ncbi:protein PFC0760c [Lucilia cuprina]|uniref:protein PFC0760c n=1 Tax=Lucilia cuprina TaxID=7375 RepID=UPI001F058158|nr:protein PFC0760c [Lucilia cuprina]
MRFLARSPLSQGLILSGPIKRTSFSNNHLTNLHKTDAIPFASSSDEEDDVIVGQTLVEINTPSMHFEDEPPTPAPRKLMSIYNESNNQLKRSEEEENNFSSEEISEEEEDDDEEEIEFKRIQDMEEKYLQQNSAKTLKEINSVSSIRSSPAENEIDNTEKETENDEFQTESENEREEEQKSDYVQETAIREESPERNQSNKQVLYSESTSELFENSETQITLKDNSLESQAQNNLMQIIQNSLTNLQISSLNNNEEHFLNQIQSILLKEGVNETITATNILNPEKIALAVVNAFKTTGITNLMSLSKQETKNEELIKLTQENNYKGDQEKTETDEANKSKESEIEIVEYKDDYEGEEEFEVEVEEIQNNEHVPNADNDNYDDNDDQDVYYNAHFDYRITSKTPTSFNSDDYIFHANFIKQFHRTNSTDKLRVKPHPRKSMSFSNERKSSSSSSSSFTSLFSLVSLSNSDISGTSVSDSFSKDSFAYRSSSEFSKSVIIKCKQLLQDIAI